MGKYQLKLPKMGESIAEATITKWLKDVGDNVEIDESLVEIATDKVDSDVPSEYKGKLIKKNFEVNDVVKVCLLYTSPSPRDGQISRMPSSA